MIIHHLSEKNSVLNHFLMQLRDVQVQKDSMRFRKNIERIGEIMAYEISKDFDYEPIVVQTPLATKKTEIISNKIVLCSILRAGISLHQGFLNYFDNAESGFISAYRHHPFQDEHFEIKVEYQAVPSLENKTLLLIDPMLATGQSIVAVLNKMYSEESPKEIHIGCVIAAPEGVAFLKEQIRFPFHLWIGSLDERLNEKKYIVPGLGDAGDLAYGSKL
ncbi:MAG TPA: uracil phosphoribosyltransferase [Flavobacterium sp.]|nr:uracil phosphoribosyltransferase [Flavobacterium sp.]